MSDMAEDFRALTEARKIRHQEWNCHNRKIIDESGIAFVDKGETLLFRNIIKADFYPSTGRWRSNNKTYSGGAQKFLDWLKKEESKYDLHP